MKNLRYDGANIFCVNDTAHGVRVIRSDDKLIGFCTVCWTYDSPPVDTLASLAWYDNHTNLAMLLDWLGDMAPSGFRHVIEKPYRYEDEYRTAVAALDHEAATGHTVMHDGSDDTGAYCDHEGCDWRVVGGVSNDAALAVTS